MGNCFRRWRLSLAILGLGTLIAVVPASAVVPGFQTGDLIVSSGVYGSLQWLRADGSVVKPLVTGFDDASGAEFDPSGRLWVVSIGENKAVTFDDAGDLTGTIVPEIHDSANPGGSPTDISFDAVGNAYIGAYEYEGPVTKFGPDGTRLGEQAQSEADHLDLASDQCTIYMLFANGGQVYSKNTCTNGPIQLVPFVGYGTYDEPNGFRLLPDGSWLIAGPYDSIALAEGVLRVAADGSLAQSYTTPECAGDGWTGVALGTDGTTFWSTCDTTGFAVEFDVATGAVLRTLSTPGIVVAVKGGFRAAQDRTAPTVSLTSPTQGASYTVGQSITATYTCSDTGGSLLTDCSGTAPNGQPIDTSSTGSKTFAVTATDGAGNTGSASVTYQVNAQQDTTPPAINLVTPAQGARYKLYQQVFANFTCADTGGSMIASCVGTVASGKRIDTLSAGTKTFTVTATDGAGNTTTSTRTYRVTATPAKSCADASRIRVSRCTTRVVEFDSMPDHDYYPNSSAATATHSNGTPVDQDQAVGFPITQQNVLLDSLDLPLWHLNGVNKLDVKLLAEAPTGSSNGQPYRPDDTVVLESWQLNDIVSSALGETGNIVHIASVKHPKLLAGKRYWVYISATEPVAYIGWLGGSFDYHGPSWWAERNFAYPNWITTQSDTQSGRALRVTTLR